MTNIKSMNFWCYNVLPLIYDDSLTYYEVICKLIEYVNESIEDDKKVLEIVNQFGVTIDELKEDVAEVQKELQEFNEGKALGVYIDALSKWIDNNLQELVGKIAKFVIFGLDDNGYFFADIPENWKDITFSTISDVDDVNYGRLVLEY